MEDLFNLNLDDFSGKSAKENRVFSTSTSPLFAIDTWRSVNPTAASTYNTYMVINCAKPLYQKIVDFGKWIINTIVNGIRSGFNTTSGWVKSSGWVS
jgi:hypothetical protein